MARAHGFDPDNPRFASRLGTSNAMGTDGPIEVSTLEHVMRHLPKRSAGGAGGADFLQFSLYFRMDASSVKPFVQFFLSPPPPTGTRTQNWPPLWQYPQELLLRAIAF